MFRPVPDSTFFAPRRTKRDLEIFDEKLLAVCNKWLLNGDFYSKVVLDIKVGQQCMLSKQRRHT